jgi:putative hydrolase of the HAD superfamily
MAKILSFDMDGTLIDQCFADAVWLEGLPRLYAQERGIGFSESKKYLLGEYDRIGSESIEWYTIQYWLKKLHLSTNWKSLLESYRDKIKVYPEVPPVLDFLKEKFILIIISNAAREFLTIELEETNLQHYFSHIFSAVTDFHQTKKDITIYEKICHILQIKPTDIIHVGDNYLFDYLVPQKLGITTFYLNRTPTHHPGNTPYTLKNLDELLSRI